MVSLIPVNYDSYLLARWPVAIDNCVGHTAFWKELHVIKMGKGEYFGRKKLTVTVSLEAEVKTRKPIINTTN